MIFFARNQRRHVPVQAATPAAERTAPNPAAHRPVHPMETAPYPIHGNPDSPFGPQHAPGIARPYAPQSAADPLTAPDIPITETAVLDYPLSRPSPARAVLMPSRHLVVLTGWPVPPAAYPDPHRDPGPARYAKAMQIVSATTGTTSSYENPRAWAARALTSPVAAIEGQAA